MTRPHEPSLQHDDSSLRAELNRNLIDRRLLPASDETVPIRAVIGVSGGADSVCLLHALHELAPARNLELHVAHLNHGLRTEAESEAVFVGELAGQLNLPFHHRSLSPGTLEQMPGNIEANARQVRYAFLCQAAYNVSNGATVPVVAVAHNAEDQAETILLHLLRGSGLRGLRGMRWKMDVSGADYDRKRGSRQPLWLIRPLLNIHRAKIEEYLRHHGLCWCEDASNRDTAFTRNHLRHRVLPLLAEINPRVVDAMTRTAEIVGDASDRLDRIDREQMIRLMLEPDVVSGDGQTVDDVAVDRIVLDLDQLAEMERPEQRGVLRSVIATILQGSDEIDFDTIDRTLVQACSLFSNSGPRPFAGELCWSILSRRSDCPRRLSLHWASALPVRPCGPHLGDGLVAKRLPTNDDVAVDGWRLCCRYLDRADMPTDWRTVLGWQAWLDADRVGTPVLSAPGDGMRLAPLGMEGRTKALGDLFTDAKVHPSLRPGWPLIVDAESGTILWVCGLRLAHDAHITDQSTRLLHLQWEPERTTDT